MNRVLKRGIMMLVMAVLMAGTASVSAEAKTGSIKVTAPSGKTVKVAKGKKVKLKTRIGKLKNKKVSYKSANPSIAIVTSKGVVKGVKKGKTKITVISKADKKLKKTIKVIVYKKAVKKINLNSNSKTLTKGSQFALKAIVLPKKNASKTLKFSSSNNKVATVDKKGVVKAVGIGAADIVVKATDGSKKKTTCKVKVVDNMIGIKSVKSRDTYSIDVELTGAKALEIEDFKVYFKVLSTDKYLREYTVDEVHTQDNIHYEVVIEEKLSYSTYTKMQIKSLAGVNTKEMIVDGFYPTDQYTNVKDNNRLEGNVQNTYIVGRVGSDIAYHSFEKNTFAALAKAATYTVSNLPKEFIVVENNEGGAPVIKGTFSTKVNGHKALITATDANGDKYYEYVYFYIGDEDTIYTKAVDTTRLTYVPNENMSRNYTPTVYISDVYNIYESQSLYEECTDFEATGLPANVRIDRHGNIVVMDENKPVKKGVYNISIKAKTPSGKNITISYKLTLVEGIVISGKITDANGVPNEDTDVTFTSRVNQDDERCVVNTKGDENGNYSVRLLPGVYNINSRAFYNSYQIDFRKSKTYNLKSNYYRVDFTNKLFVEKEVAAVNDDPDLLTVRKDGTYIIDKLCYSYYVVNEKTGKRTLKLYGYLKKGETYMIIPDFRYTFFIDDVEYNIIEKEFKFTGQKTESIELERL